VSEQQQATNHQETQVARDEPSLFDGGEAAPAAEAPDATSGVTQAESDAPLDEERPGWAVKPAKGSDANLFINRELGMVAFQARVLEEAWEKELPLLERVKFIAILGSSSSRSPAASSSPAQTA